MQSAQAKVNGYWLTGDLAYRDEEGRYIHVDRIPDAIDTVSGRVYSLLTEEIIFSALPELIECSVFPQTRNEITLAQAVVVYPKLKPIPDMQQVLQIINSALQDYQQPPISSVTAVEHERVLRGVTGKVLKRKLATNISECEELK